MKRPLTALLNPLLPAVFCCSVTMVASVAAQQTTVEGAELRIDSPLLERPGPVDLSNIPWRFRAGDHPSGADPELDDSAWQLLTPWRGLDSLATQGWPGIGWFRLHLLTDSTMRRENLSLTLAHLGASEIYLNGQLVHSFGTVDDDPSAFVGHYPTPEVPVLLDLDDRARQVLAIRYAFPEARQTVERYGGLQLNPFLTGFQAEFDHSGIALAKAARPQLVSQMASFFMGVLMLLGFLHAVLWLLDTRDRSNLYLSMVSVLLAVHLVLFYYMEAVRGTDIDVLLFLNMTALVTVLVALPLYLLLVGEILYDRVPRWIWLLAGLGWAAIPIGYFQTMSSRLMIFSFVLLVAALVPTTRGMIRGKRWAGTIAVGTGLFTVGLILVILYASPTETIMFPIGLSLLFLSIPVSMSVLLARRFVDTNRRLEREMDEVKRLSEKTVEQEREKQRLIAEQNVRLEHQVEERTAELKASVEELHRTQAQLVEQEKLASLGSLTAGIAHEIKNPLNFVNNFAEVSEELMDELAAAVSAGDTDEAVALLGELRENARQIAKHGGRADSIVRSMMQHARGGASERETIDMNAFVEEYVDLAWHGMRARDHEFQCDIERDLDPAAGSVEGLPQDLGRVLLNLLNNAFHAVQMEGAAASARIRISTARADGRVAITVEDSGPGIPDEIRSRIFEPFFTTKPTGEGTGLGLSLSYDIVTKGHGGELTVGTSDLGGARFAAVLPVK